MDQSEYQMMLEMSGGAGSGGALVLELRQLITRLGNGILRNSANVDRNVDHLVLLRKLVDNLITNPNEAKFRTINSSNAKIAAFLSSCPEAAQTLEKVGFRRDAGTGKYEIYAGNLDVGKFITARDIIDQLLEAYNNALA